MAPGHEELEEVLELRLDDLLLAVEAGEVVDRDPDGGRVCRQITVQRDDEGESDLEATIGPDGVDVHRQARDDPVGDAGLLLDFYSPLIPFDLFWHS